MKLANLGGRATIITDDGVIDIQSASAGRFSADPDQAIRDLDAVQRWLHTDNPSLDPTHTRASLDADLSLLGPPVTAPSQIFAVGLNYVDHSTETGLAVPTEPLIFTKFASAIAGPAIDIPLPTTTCDWEIELVAVIGKPGRNIRADDALAHVAGLCVGQDISERTSQMAGSPPQFGLAKSFQAFAPIGPWLTTLDEIADPARLALSCTLDREVVQTGSTADMVFDLSALVTYLSGICELRTGDLIFTGTPAGVGYSRTPARYLTPGATLRSEISGLGHLSNTCR